jgi:hypothetical protein
MIKLKGHGQVILDATFLIYHFIIY